MTEQLRDKFYGYTIDEWISKVPGELSVDAVGLMEELISDYEAI